MTNCKERLMKNFLKPWEVVLAALIVFFACSASLYWYDRLSKHRIHTIKGEMTDKWQQDTLKWQDETTTRINSMVVSQKQITDFLNANISAGRLTVPQKEKK